MRLFVVATALLLLAQSTSVWGISSPERWDTEVAAVPQNKEMQDAGINTWTIPVGPTGIRAIITEENPTCFTVKYVFKNSPASGKLKPGDLICGANGKKLEKAHHFAKKIQGGKGMAGPLTEMAPIIEAAQGSNGKLDLLYHPGGNTMVTKKATVLLKPVGRFSPTYPFNCERSDKIVNRLCEMIESEFKRTSRHRIHVRTHMQLALMASGDKQYDSLIREHAQGRADAKVEMIGPGFPSWGNGFEGIFLGEYYLKTKDRKVLPRIKELNLYYIDGMGYENGGFSHRSRPYIIDRIAGGGPPGYGAMSAPGGLSMLAMSLFRAGGAPYSEFAHERTHRAYLQAATDEKLGVGYGFPVQPSIHILVKNPKDGQSGRGIGYRCPTGMKGIKDYEIKGVSLWCNTSPTNTSSSGKKPWSSFMWEDTSWLEKERDRNIVVEWAGNQRHVIRSPILSEPTKPYNTAKGNSQAGCGLGALAHLIGNSDRKSWEYLGKHAANASALAPEGWFQGHAAMGIHQLWQALGAARADKEKFRSFMDEVKWWFIMMECHDGSYMSCPNRDRANSPNPGPYTMPSANAALILSLPRRQIQITGAGTPSDFAPASSSAPYSAATSAGTGASSPAQPEPGPQPVAVVRTVRKARSLSPDRRETLDGALLKTLAAMGDAGQLKSVPLTLSFTRSKVVLKSATTEGSLQFQIAGGSNTARMRWRKLGADDRATLSLLVAHLKPESGDAQAMAGVYLESVGKVEQADQYYIQAGERSRKKLEALFE